MALASAFGIGVRLRYAVACTAALGTFAVPPARAAAAPATNSPAHPYDAPVAEAAQRFGIPELWIWRVMHAESRGKPGAVSHAGAMGLMQIMPATWTMLSARHRLGNDPFDVRANILAGAAYLRAMWDRYRSVSLMLVAYNAGPGRADAYAAGRHGLPAETLAYVARLAPALGSGVDRQAPIARNDPPSWRDASLFAGRRDPVPEGADERAKPASPAPLDPLFVRLSGREQ